MAVCEVDLDYIEYAVHFSDLPLDKVTLCGFDQLFLLTAIDRFRWKTEGIVSSGLHFDKDQVSAFFGNDVDLAIPAVIVTLDDP